MTWMFLWLGIGHLELVEWREEMQMTTKIAFDAAMDKEKKLRIKKMVWDYDAKRSPNDISGEGKQEWDKQYFLISEDPNRHLLDSLFRVTLTQQRVPVSWSAVSCSSGRKTRSVTPVEQLQGNLIPCGDRYTKIC